MRRWLAVALALLGAACSDEPIHRAAPLAPLAALVLEPPRVGLGEVAVLELAVITPPDHAPRPFRPPQELAGFWLMDAERLDVEKEPLRWVHRTRLRLRARAVGSFLWPAGEVEVEAPDGSVQSVPVPELPLEVASVRSDHPDRTSPFGVRGPPVPGRPVLHTLLAAAGGSLLTLAALGLLALGRRRRAHRPEAATPRAQPLDPPWIAARARLAEAAALADPVEGAHRVAATLRQYMAQRFRADATARTSEELAAAAPPFAATSRWPVFVGLLRELDAFRFCAPGTAARRTALAERLAGLVRRAEAFVDDSVPPQARP